MPYDLFTFGPSMVLEYPLALDPGESEDPIAPVRVVLQAPSARVANMASNNFEYFMMNFSIWLKMNTHTMRVAKQT